MKKYKTKIFYLTYCLVVLVIFLVILFPSEKINNTVKVIINDIHPNYNFDIKELSLGLVSGVQIYDTNIYENGNLFANVEELVVNPSFFSLVSKNKTLNINTKLYKGEIKGKIDILNKPKHKDFIIDAEIKNIQLDNIIPIKRLVKQKINGFLNANINFVQSGLQINGNADVNLNKLMIKLDQPIFKVKSLFFNMIDANLILNNNKIDIKNCIFSGKQINGEIKGDIKIQIPYQKSKFNLSGKLKPVASFVEKLQKDFPIGLLNSKKGKNAFFSFKIKGTFDKPNFLLN